MSSSTICSEYGRPTRVRMLARSFSLLTVLAPAYCTSIARTIDTTGATGADGAPPPLGSSGAGGGSSWPWSAAGSASTTENATTAGTMGRKFMVG